MEAKTIGSFISALRRAAGMTQKDFAERLNVSDKTVSRWEREESAPDLTVIPVIAEIFGVTCDELLRGERKNPNGHASAADDEEETSPKPPYSAKAEKQRTHLIRTTLARHRGRSLYAIYVAGVGFLGAMILNTAFNRAYLGFFIAAILYLAAIVCEVILVNGTLASITEDAAEGKALTEFRYRVYTDARVVFVLTAVLLAACIPLLLVGDAYWGLTSEMWLIWGTGFALIAAVLCSVILYFTEDHLLRENIISYPEKTAAVIMHRRKLKKNLVLIGIILLSLSTLLCSILTGFGSPYAIADSIRFDDIDSFIAFAEQDISDTDTAYSASVPYSVICVVPDEQPLSDAVYYDQSGNVISEEEAMTRTVKDSSGETVIQYVERNDTISSVTFGTESEGFLPIHVKTTAHILAAKRQIDMIHAVFFVLYILEVISLFAAYILLRSPKKDTRTA